MSAERNPNEATQRKRYAAHPNSPANEGYVSMLRLPIARLQQQGRGGRRILDYGCEPSPLLVERLRRDQRVYRRLHVILLAENRGTGVRLLKVTGIVDIPPEENSLAIRAASRSTRRQELSVAGRAFPPQDAYVGSGLLSCNPGKDGRRAFQPRIEPWRPETAGWQANLAGTRDLPQTTAWNALQDCSGLSTYEGIPYLSPLALDGSWDLACGAVEKDARSPTEQQLTARIHDNVSIRIPLCNTPSLVGNPSNSIRLGGGGDGLHPIGIYLAAGGAVQGRFAQATAAVGRSLDDPSYGAGQRSRNDS